MTNNISNLSSMKIILCNANGLRQKEPELLNFLIGSQIDTALISETCYTQNTKHFPMAKTNHPDGTSHAGTVTVLILSKIQNYPLLPLQSPTIQTTFISITLTHSGSIFKQLFQRYIAFLIQVYPKLN